ncbi:uncharacterized protein LOC135114687 isoform X4 [Scylla paramamosain]|uniref:uncharacterized protein LOC135114687 isoform X4 n=1 Tax=Scylla paramamosain TaxID=85552 RepID=UPI003083CA4C
MVSNLYTRSLQTRCQSRGYSCGHSPHFSLHRAPPSSTRVRKIPQDLFIDIVEAKNFLACALTGLFANTEDSTTCLPSPLVLKVCHFKDHLSLPSSSGI